MNSSFNSTFNSTINDTEQRSIGTTLDHIPWATQAFMTIAYAFSFIFGIIGNGFGLFIARRSTKGHVSTNVLIGNMALADLLVTVFAMPHSVSFLYVQNLWIGGIVGEIGCKLAQFPFVISIAASIFTILAISVERFWAIYFPLKAHLLKKPKVLTSLIWICSIAFFCPYLFFYTVEQGREGRHFCVVKWGSDEETYRIQRTYYLVIFIFLYAIPLAFITILYTLTGLKLWKMQRPGQDTSTRKSAITGKRKVLRLLVALVLVFTICWLPSHIMHYYMFYDVETWSQIPIAIKALSFWISHTNSAINPGIYVLLSEHFRREFLRITNGLACLQLPPQRVSSSKSRRTGKRKGTLSTRVWIGSKKKERTLNIAFV